MAQEKSEKGNSGGLQEDSRMLEMTAWAIGTSPRRERGVTSAHRTQGDVK